MSLKQLIASTFYEKSSGGGGGGTVPSGGLTGNALVKNSNTDFDTKWLGVSTIGTALMVLATPGAPAYLRLNADGTVDKLSAADFKTALSIAAGIGGSTGSVDKTLLMSNGTGGATVQASDFIETSGSGLLFPGSSAVQIIDRGSGLDFVDNPVSAWKNIRCGAIGASGVAALGAGADLLGTNIANIANIISSIAGKGLQLKGGTDQRAGNATLVGGTVTVTNTTVTANTKFQVTRIGAGGTLGSLTVSKSIGASFTVDSTNPFDTSSFDYMMTEVN